MFYQRPVQKKMGKADKSWIFFVYPRGSYSELIDTGASTGGSGRNLRPNWAHGGENYTLKARRGKNSPRYMGHT